jgi:ribosomal-protein-alanine N-acetyltransferase
MIAADRAHVPVMATIHHAAFPAGAAWSETEIAASLALPGVYGLIHPKGGMVMARCVADEAEILTLAVTPGVRRQGVGRALLRSAIEAAESRGCPIMFLEVSSSNLPALTLYQNTGFKPVGSRSGYYGPGLDALILRRTAGSRVGGISSVFVSGANKQ